MLFDLHVHTNDSSPCGCIDAKDLPALYKERGYDGIVITDHFVRSCMVNHYDLSYDDYCVFHKKGYEAAKEAGEKIGITVFYGIELRLDATGNNDYLVFGMPNEFLYENKDIFTWSVSRLKEAADATGFIFYQAHPFRNTMNIVDPQYLFGVEVFNGKPYVQPIDSQRNEIANLWADKFSLHKIAGSDCHRTTQLATAGVKFACEIKSENDFIQALKNDDYYLVERASKSK